MSDLRLPYRVLAFKRQTVFGSHVMKMNSRTFLLQTAVICVRRTGVSKTVLLAAGLLLATAANAQTAPQPLQCPAGTEYVSLTLTGSGSTYGGTTTLWGPAGTPTATYNLTASGGSKVDLTLTWSNFSSSRNTATPAWRPYTNDDLAVSAAFKRAAANTLLANYTIQFSRDVTHFRYVVYNVDARYSQPSWLDVYRVTTGNPTLTKWGSGYNTVSGLDIIGSTTPVCTQTATCDAAKVSVIYPATTAARTYTGEYRQGAVNTGNQTVNSNQFVGFNNYEACLAPPAPKLTVRKTVASRSATTDEFTVRVTNGAATPTVYTTATTTSGSTSATSTTYTATAGTTYTFDEIAAGTPATQLSRYNTTYSCTNATVGSSTNLPSGSARSFNLTPAAGDDITCTFTNTAIRQQFALTKSWVGGTDGDTATATTSGAANNATFTSRSTGGTGQTGAPGASVTMTAGEIVTLPAETGVNIGNYTQAVYCTGGTMLGSSSAPLPLPQTITISASTTATTCTYVNTRKTFGVSLAKFWTNGKPGDAVSLAISGTGVTGAAGGNSIVDGGSTNATATAAAGSTITLAESFTTGSSSNYTTTLACIRNSDGSVVGTSPDGLSRTITMPSDSAVTCTYTNARIAQQLNLAKTWVNAVSGHTASGTTTGGTANPTFTSTAPTATTGTAVTVYAGDVVTLPAETFGGGATAASYNTTVACTGGSPLASGATGRTLTIQPSTTTATTCTYTNSGQFANLSITKTNNQTQLTSGTNTTYTIVVTNAGPLAANGAVLRDVAGTAGLNCTLADLPAPQCTASNGAACPAPASLTYANLSGSSGVAIPVLPVGGSVEVQLTCRVR